MADLNTLHFLKGFTNARIAIGRTGTSIPVTESLDFKMAHAHARDAVYSSMDIPGLTAQLAPFNLPVIELHSMAADRAHYLQRPDLGRQLSTQSEDLLAGQITGFDVVICIADGLSALAIHENIAGLLDLLIPKLVHANFSLAPICLIQQGRVAIADGIAEQLQAKLSIVFIGERPGLSAADSLGAYLTYGPKRGLTDDSRNCVSNIRAAGLAHEPAASKIFYLIQEAFQRKLSGVLLKDNEGLLR
ncbi:ethanolamine ammonia-lyase subunit EutC [Pedobacter metabolipauper]|uniref:Ethanolamine ammonia-lyase small subunit n=1 Tax=Pedobacter metabolipauper TaxID=425513 RepID=A0A4R6SZM2_9SPHI|nr:ethanolamine ammonia-lyase subunit EutC [Pedobacter metabolipauper]TDQ11537.1 ethanolamine ammonia-lyase light chain [Pedobacter metabolipauper]